MIINTAASASFPLKYFSPRPYYDTMSFANKLYEFLVSYISCSLSIADLPAPALVHEPVGAALDCAHPVHRAYLRVLQLDIAAVLQQ